MRYASTVVKAVSFIFLTVLFGLFLHYAVSFGESGNDADLTKCNILVAVMILILVISAIIAVTFEAFERSRWQNEQIFSTLNNRINSLLEMEDRIKQITMEHGEKMEQLHNNLADKVAENTAKIENYMTQFANLSVQVFSKDKQMQNMQHNEISGTPAEFSGDYFNHYTEKTPEDIITDEPEVLQPEDKVEFADEPEVLQSEDKAELTDGPEVLQPESKVEFTDEPEVLQPGDKVEDSLSPKSEQISDNSEDFTVSDELALPEDSAPQNLIDNILNGENKKSGTSEQPVEDRLSSIFNDELANTLAGLEIMKDDNNSKPDEIDLASYFSDEEKIKL